MYTPEFSKPRVLSVSQLNFYIKSIIENDARLNFVFVTGEISNLTDHYRSGHIYLSIKDEKSVIRAVMFAGNARNLKFRPTDGMKVICRGRVAVYEPTGQYQLYIEDMQPDGIGALSLAYEQLKKSLAEKGLFAPEHKKKIPPFPNSIGVITSPTGAAVQDIRNILSRRFPSADIIMCPVLVQGENAPAQLIDAVQKLDKYNACDVIIIGRGGGSIEDLWAFNEERVVRAIASSEIPVVTAIGHETDFTLADFAADRRAATPSQAAEIVVPNVWELIRHLEQLNQRNIRAVTALVERNESKILEISNSLVFKEPDRWLADKKIAVDNCLNRIFLSMNRIQQEFEHKYALLVTRLDASSPLNIMSRGYSIARKADGTIIKTIDAINIGESIETVTKDGFILSAVTDVKRR